MTQELGTTGDNQKLKVGLTVTRPTHGTAASVTQPSWVQHGLLGGTVPMFTCSFVPFLSKGVALPEYVYIPTRSGGSLPSWTLGTVALGGHTKVGPHADGFLVTICVRLRRSPFPRK